MDESGVMDASRLLDVFAIQQTKSRYFRYLDTKQWALWRRLFTDDLVFYMENTALPSTMEPITVGADEFVEHVSNQLSTSVTVHHGHMPDIEFRGPDEADVVWAMFDWVDDPDHDHAIQGFGHYHETYRKGADGTWRIATLRLTRLRRDDVQATRPSGERPWPPAWSASGSASGDGAL